MRIRNLSAPGSGMNIPEAIYKGQNYPAKKMEIVLIMIVILKQWSLEISPNIYLLYFYLTTAVIIMGNKVLLRRI